MRRSLVAALAALGLGAAPAAAAPAEVTAQFQQFAPSQIDVLPGETVEWTNASERRHTITADDGSFDSGDFFSGDHYTHTYDEIGGFPYHCRVHAGMVGEVDVRRVILDFIPPAAVPAGQRIELTGRTADVTSPVTIELDSGGGFKPVTTATPAPDGAWSTNVAATTTGDYRAVSGADVSETRRLLVTDRKVHIRATRTGVHVTVTPSDPHAVVLLELDLRERFGWWPATAQRLDYLSRADFRVAPGTRVRAVLVDRDGWTPVASSPTLRLRRR